MLWYIYCRHCSNDLCKKIVHRPLYCPVSHMVFPMAWIVTMVNLKLGRPQRGHWILRECGGVRHGGGVAVQHTYFLGLAAGDWILQKFIPSLGWVWACFLSLAGFGWFAMPQLETNWNNIKFTSCWLQSSLFTLKGTTSASKGLPTVFKTIACLLGFEQIYNVKFTWQHYGDIQTSLNMETFPNLELLSII